MAITLVGAGSFVDGTNVAITPTAPSYQIGDALFYCTGQFFGAASVTPAAGWTQLSDNSTQTAISVWGRIAATTSETIPSVNWGPANKGWAQITVFRGLDTSFTKTVAGASERGQTVTQNIGGPSGSRLPTQDNSLAFWIGGMNKTSTTDGKTYSPPANWTIAAQNIPNGTTYTAVLAYWIQTTATSVPANPILTGSIAESVAQSTKSDMFFIAQAASSGGGGGNTGTVAFPPPKRKTYVYYDFYYPR